MKTVLVIDDDPKFRESLTGLLKQSGYHALEAADGRDQPGRALRQGRRKCEHGPHCGGGENPAHVGRRPL